MSSNKCSVLLNFQGNWGEGAWVGGMANIIIIENDQRVIQDMTSFFKELDEEHQVRVFESPTAFEKRYFLSDEDKGLLAHPLMLTTPPSYIPWFLEQDFSSEAPFTDPEIRWTVSRENFSSLSGPKDTEVLFGLPFGEIAKSKLPFDGQVADHFKKLWLSFLQNSAESGRGAGLFPFKDANDALWLISFRAQAQNDTLNLYFKDETLNLVPMIKEEIERSKKPDVEDEKTKLLGIVHLLLFKSGLVKVETKEWVQRTQKQLKDGRFWPVGNQTRMIVTKYEDDGVDKLSLVHPFIDDLIFFPMDRLLFLQKVEMVMNLPGLTRPRYLFNQQVNFEIEISKRSRLERLSDLGFAIRNPIGLQEGLTAHFHLTIPISPDPLDIHAKVMKSKRHPENPSQYLIFFSFLAPPKEYITIIRKYLASDSHYRPILDEDPTHFKYNQDNIFLTKEDKRIKTVAVIDPDDKVLKSLQQMFKTQIQQVKFVKESSFYLFSKKYFETATPKSPERRASPAQSDDLFADRISWMVDPVSHNIEKFLTSPKEGDQILGYDAIMLFFQPQGWLDLFKDKDNKEVLQESIQVASSGQRVKKVFELSHQDGGLRFVTVELNQAFKKNLPMVKFEISLPTLEELRSEMSMDNLDSLDLLLIDQSMVPEETEGWIVGIQQNAVAAGLVKGDRQLRVIVMGNIESRAKLKALRYSKISAIVPKPIETRQLLAHVSVGIQCPFTVYNFENLGWSNRSLTAQMAKSAELIEIAEYGCSIRHSRPIVAGTTLFLHGSIFSQAPGKCLAARVYHCDKDEKVRGQYVCHLMYYGITESFLKYTRSWIRENYVSKKTGQTEKK